MPPANKSIGPVGKSQLLLRTKTTMNSLKPRKDEFSRGYTEAVNAVPN